MLILPVDSGVSVDHMADASGLNLISQTILSITVEAATSTGNLRSIPEKEPEK